MIPLNDCHRSVDATEQASLGVLPWCLSEQEGIKDATGPAMQTAAAPLQ